MLADGELEAQADLDHAVDLIKDAKIEAATKLLQGVLIKGNKSQKELASYYLSLMASIEPLSHQNNDQQDVVPNEKRQGFFIGEFALMISYVDGSQLLDFPSVYPLPHSPSWFYGLSNINGNIIPVFDLADFFGLPVAIKQKPMLLVLGYDENATGIIIDGLPQRLEFMKMNKIERNNIPESIVNYVEEAYQIDKSLWFDLNTSSLFDAIEQKLSI